MKDSEGICEMAIKNREKGTPDSTQRRLHELVEFRGVALNRRHYERIK